MQLPARMYAQSALPVPANSDQSVGGMCSSLLIPSQPQNLSDLLGICASQVRSQVTGRFITAATFIPSLPSHVA